MAPEEVEAAAGHRGSALHAGGVDSAEIGILIVAGRRFQADRPLGDL
jgi:hypothetical protein